MRRPATVLAEGIGQPEGPTILPDGVINTFTSSSHADNIEQEQNGQISPQYLRSLNLKIEGESPGGRFSWAFDGSDSSNIASSYTNPAIFAVMGYPIQVNYTNNGGIGIPSVSTTPTDLTDPAAVFAHYTFVGGTYAENDIQQFTLDGTWHGTDGWGPLQDLRFGAYDQRNYYDTYSTYNAGSVCAYCGYSAAVPSGAVHW